LEKDTLLIDLHYLPSLTYFTKVLAYTKIALVMYGQYQKQSYSNRCYILGAQKVDRLTVPVIGGKKQVPYSMIKIDNQQKWAQTHWRTIKTNYGKAPYFEYMETYFQSIFWTHYTYLYELSLTLFTLCLDLLQLKKTVTLQTSSMYSEVEGVHAIHDINPKKQHSISKIYQPVAYQQVFGTEFIGNLSIIDLLFCKGPEACKVLEASMVHPACI